MDVAHQGTDEVALGDRVDEDPSRLVCRTGATTEAGGAVARSISPQLTTSGMTYRIVPRGEA